ncbi:hypothetical protein O6H91_02G039200 [Diphasiastrum complanatum]|nr:hypothetical protein O6H91_02G039200 [Diphasiastrum complanatum]KAJ7564912.1 hypothetical protein O6H91_02G039200 [Diphasiastrum complanatum]
MEKHATGISAGTLRSVGQLPPFKLLSGGSVKYRSGCSVRLRRQCVLMWAVATSSVNQNLRSARPENVPGEFFVDHTCIDCDTCRWMAPKVFTQAGEKSAVQHQPVSENERVAALQALLSCPTSSIHTIEPPPDILQIQATFPLPIDLERLPGVYHCGFHSKKSFGAASYIITRSDGNILVDSPRYTEPLARRLEELGGVRYMFLSHKDDIADHARWQKRFHCDRILHKEEVQPDTADVEIKLEGGGLWNIGLDIDLIFTPGHTEGCVSLLYKPLRALFTGDHLAASSEGGLSIHRDYNWYSVKLQIDSTRSLLPMDFVWVLPGHGRRLKFKDINEKNEAIKNLIDVEEAIQTKP